jgi:nitrite reductase/ring-hydroxylating ferredoxin subunit
VGQLTTAPQPQTLRVGDSVCASHCLQDGGSGVRFQIEHHGRLQPAFVVRHAGTVVAYLNRCAHKHIELDWQEGEFFDVEHRYLVCTTHGALYDPANGLCVDGPCRGAALTPIPVREAEGAVWLAETAAAVLK